MKLHLSIAAACLAACSLFACSGKAEKTETQAVDTSADEAKAIVCYFSATGTTKAQAERIADLAAADIVELCPETPYTDDDLNWRDENSRSSVEMRDADSRPALAEVPVDFADYQVVYIGYPNWWNTAPRIINTFIEGYDLRGKTIKLFMTSGGSDITNSIDDLKATYPNLNFADGLLMNDVTDDEISAWAATR